MIKKIEFRALIILLLNLAYYFMLNTINMEFSPHVYLMLPALFIVPAAKWLGMGALIFTVAVSSLIVDRFVPLPTGIAVIIWLLAAAFARFFCVRTEKINAFWAIGIMETVNFSILFFYALVLPNSLGAFSDYAIRVFVDIAAAALVLVPISKWSIELPESIVNLFEGKEKDSY